MRRPGGWVDITFSSQNKALEQVKARESHYAWFFCQISSVFDIQEEAQILTWCQTTVLILHNPSFTVKIHHLVKYAWHALFCSALEY